MVSIYALTLSSLCYKAYTAKSQILVPDGIVNMFVVVSALTLNGGLLFMCSF